MAGPNTITVGKGELQKITSLNRRQRKQLLEGPTGTAFDQYTRMFAAFQGGDVFETGEWRCRDLDEMLRRDGDANMVEQALTLPPRSATYQLTPAKGDTGELEMVQQQLYTPSYSGGINPHIDLIISQMTGASIYRKAFFEKQYELLDSGEVVLSDLEWRPPSTCEIKRDEHTAKFDGFRQRAWWFSVDPKKSAKKTSSNGSNKPGQKWLGYEEIPKVRAFVYIHNQHRAPLIGESDMDVTYWCYKQKLKLMFLWFQFLECQSLPKLAVYGSDPDQAEDNASTIAQMKASGVAGFERPPGGDKLFDVIAASGSGAQQFQESITYLSAFSAKSIMGGFLDLGNAATLGRGSYALSESQSQFFLQAREANVKEMCRSFTADVIAPLVILNRGPDAAVPTLGASPLTQGDSQQVISALTTLAAAPALRIPDQFVLLIAQKAAEVMNLPEGQVTDIINKAIKQAQDQPNQVLGPAGQTPEGQGAQKIGVAAQTASNMVKEVTGAGSTTGATATSRQ